MIGPRGDHQRTTAGQIVYTPAMSLDSEMKARTINGVNPATGASLLPVTCTTPGELKATVARARTASGEWAATSFEDRAAALRSFCKSLSSAEVIEELASTMTSEMGKPLEQARGELRSVGPRMEGLIDRARQACVDEETNEGQISVTVQWRPMGVAAVIAPWNYPVSTPNNLIVSALLTGNSVVFKPSEVTPRTGALYYELLRAALPAGVCGLVQGEGDIGAALVASDVDIVAFTGSVSTGQRIMKAAADRMCRLVLELGGKDPMIVMRGADLHAAAAHAVRESVRNSGQVCVAVERVFVDEAIHDKFMDLVRDEVAKVTVGDPRTEGITMGPMSSAQQRNLVLEHLDDARARGGIFVHEHKTWEPGHFLSPAVVTGVTEEMRLAREETFGPVVAVSTFHDVEDALGRANASPFGLGASVWGGENDDPEGVADRVNAGMVGINRGLSAAAGAPWVGWKQSGLGYTRSVAGMRTFLQPRTKTRKIGA